MTTPAESLPWNAGGPDADLVRLVDQGRIPVGHALDLGTGPGHDAVFLIERAFQVIAIDIKAGRILWRYTRRVPAGTSVAHQTTRGVALWGDKVFFASGEAVLVALNAKTGEKKSDHGNTGK